MSRSLMSLARRDNEFELSHTMSTLLVVLLVLLIAIVALGGALVFLRQRRKARLAAAALPMYTEKRISTSSTHSNHRRINVRPSQSIHIYNEKQIEIGSGPPTPTSPLPEIRITFPEEVDAAGKRQSGRVVVVHVGDTGVGLEPVNERLPPYQQSDSDRFQSIDLERIGGLNEKEIEVRQPLGWR